MTETEIKSMIDKDLYKSILNAFTWEKVREQTNYYYTDKAGILREKRIMVRIRVVGEVAKIQVKLHKNENSPLQICEENEFETEEVPDIINAELAKEITGEDVGELYKMGCAVTIRNSLVHNGSELCLDKTTYFDKTDYEVEVEYEEKISADLLMKLTSLGVRFNEKCVGKFSRFLAEYKNHIVLIVSNRQTRAMFDEALQGQLTMQEEINSLKGIDNSNTENTDNAENSENTADFENSAEENGNQ